MAPPPILSKRDGAGVAGYVIIPVAALCVLIFILVHFVHSRRRQNQNQGQPDNGNRHVQPLPIGLLHLGHGSGHHHHRHDHSATADDRGQVYFGTEPAQDPVPMYTKYPTEPPPVYDPKQPVHVRTSDVGDTSVPRTSGDTTTVENAQQVSQVIDASDVPEYPALLPQPNGSHR